jgi:hypothetical protein
VGYQQRMNDAGKVCDFKAKALRAESDRTKVRIQSVNTRIQSLRIGRQAIQKIPEFPQLTQGQGAVGRAARIALM